MIIDIVSKSFSKTMKIFDARMTGSCPSFKLTNLNAIMRIRSTDDVGLPSIPIVADNQLSVRNFFFQTCRSKDANVVS
jgi:hypothetical protein